MSEFGNLLRARWGVGKGISEHERHLQYKKEQKEKELFNQYECDLSFILNDDLKTRKKKYKSVVCHYKFTFKEWLDITNDGELDFWSLIQYNNKYR